MGNHHSSHPEESKAPVEKLSEQLQQSHISTPNGETSGPPSAAIRLDGAESSNARVAVLSRDVFFVIAGFLSARDLAQCEQTCRYLYKLCSNEAIWTRQLAKDSPGWFPYVPAVTVSNGHGQFPSFRVMYKALAKQALTRRISFSAKVGGNVRIENDSKKADHYSSYGTSKSAQHFRDGLHYCEVLVHYKSVYCGIGVLNEQTTLPSAGTGAWLGTGGIMWVANSGLWGYTNHQVGMNVTYVSGSKVGVMLDLRNHSILKGGSIHWYLDGKLVGSLDLRPSSEEFAFCFCVGDGDVSITSTTFPSVWPSNVLPPPPI